ncbi:MAG: 4-hydroxyphenylpyruvate dioxygenase [Chloroflexota bacterium]|nr:4-hydroxyphenylpyruvate dioxygenase [Chloroflexota bacterium]
MAIAVRPTGNPAHALNDFMPLHGIDHVELWVGNAYQAAQFYRTLFGFDIVAFAGEETGVRDRASYVLRQGTITLVVTAGLGSESPIVQHVALHGDGVHDIALRVDDAEHAFREATRRGAGPALEPITLEGEHGVVRRSAITTYGDTLHSFVERHEFRGAFLPGYRRTTGLHGDSCGLKAIDHVVGNVELGQMERWVAFYRDVMGFSQLVHFSDEQISTEFTALMSKVVQDGSTRVKFPINEPAPGRGRSQIQEYLDYNHGPGVQHIALLTGDIVETVRAMQARGVRFLRVPDTYYAHLRHRVGEIREDLHMIRELGILVDRDEHGYLLQTFTRPMEDRPTLFFEIIQRRGARGFGVGNFKALFEAIELEQARRGNL